MSRISQSTVLSSLAGAAMLGLSLWFVWGGAPASADVREQAQYFVSVCSGEGDLNACYEREVPTLYPTHSIPHIFEVIRAIRMEDPEYQFCHVLAHKLGEAVVAEDPDRWLDAIPLNPSDGMCSNGFVHGVVGGRFRAEVLDPETLVSLYDDFKLACEPHSGWAPSPLDQAICYHGLGHLYVFITDADLPRALEICEATTNPEGLQDYRQVCREGVFMQIYQPLEPDDFLLIERMAMKPTKETVREFCAAYRKVPEYEGACLRESWPLFREEITNGSGVANFCANHPNDAEQHNCYKTATAIIGRMSLGNPQKATSACLALRTEWQGLCFVTVATSIIEEDRNAGEKAMALCKAAHPSIARQCLIELASRSTWFFGSDHQRRSKFCDALPEDLVTYCR